MDDIDENFLERHGLVRTHRGNRRRRARTIANRVNRTRNVDNNREYLFNMRDRLFQAIFQRATMTYAKTIPKTMRRTIEIFLLLKALLAFFSLIYIHFQFSKNSAITLNSVVKNWPETGILRLELSDDLSYVQETDSDLKLSDLCMKVFQTKKNPSKIRSRYTLNPHGLKTTCFRNNTNNVLQNMTNIINELLLENLKSEHIVEYSIEQGLLRLSDELRKKFNVPVLRVVINASNDDCFGSTVSRVLIEEYLGYDDFLTSVLKNVARSHGSNVEHETRRRHQSRLYMEQQVERARNVIASANEVVRMEMENRVVETQSVGTETDPDGEIVGDYTLLLTVERYDHNAESSLGEEIPELDNYTALHIAVEAAKPAVVETLLGYGAEVHVRGGKQRETPLHIAARVPDGDRCALMLLKSGAAPNHATEDGYTALHVAAQHGNLATLLLLLEDGGDPLCKSKNGETPLHLACRSCKADIVKHLIDLVEAKHGAEIATNYINLTNDEGATALHCACNISSDKVEIPGSDKEIVRILIMHGADVSLVTRPGQESAFHYCAMAGNNDIMSEMIAHMSATDIQKAMNRQSAAGWTPLLIACNRGHMELVNNLLANHARVDVFDIEGRSALHLAAEHGYLQVCDALLTNKAFINSKSRVGRTALHLAAMNGFAHLVRFLIRDHNAVIDILTLRKQTPLHLAAASGQLEVCKLLLDLGANIDATDDLGQKPIHVAAQNNFSDVAKLFLQRHPVLVTATSKDGNTCAHIAAMQGSVRVIEELMKFDRNGVISARNKITDSTPLQLAAEGGHAEVVKALVRAGASCTEENKAGFTAVHLAAQNGHGTVLEVMRSTNSLRISSKKLGLTPLHVAAYFGQADTVRELLTHVPGTVKSDAPTGTSLVGELGAESGMTPLHLAAYSGNENVVRLLLNSAGVQVDAATTENGYNPLHLACFGGHMSVVGLLLSRSAELLHSADRHGKTGLHIASTHGHYQMVEVLLGQGAEINATDRNGWTPLHCAAKAGRLEVVKLLCESGASPKSETNHGCAPIWFAASEGHNEVLKYLMTKEHDTYGLMEDRRFVYNLMVCSKNHGNKPIEEFVLVSPAPVDTAAKLSNIYMNLSTKEKERAKDLIAAGKQCETMATELLALAAGADSAGRVLTSTDRMNTEFLDVLIENEQKEVIAHTVVQRYLQELWRGSLTWPAWKIMLLFFVFIIVPPVWVVFTLPLGHKYNKVPIIKFMSYLTSHIYLMIHLMIVGITPIYPVVRASLLPYWYEWGLLIWLSGLLLFELTNPSDKSGLGSIKLMVLLFGICGVGVHLSGIVFVEKQYWATLMYCRNQCFALSFLLACVQILDFLSFHHLFGPWAIIIGDLLKDLARFLAVLAIFVFGFSMHIVALNQPFENKLSPDAIRKLNRQDKGYFSDGSKERVPRSTDAEWLPDWHNTTRTYYYGHYRRKHRPGTKMTPIDAFEKLFFAVFGQTTPDDLNYVPESRPEWTQALFKIVFGVYMLVSVVVLINLLIAMMSDTYQRIQAQSDIEWKFGLSKLIRNMHRTSTAPSPLNLITTWFIWIVNACKMKMTKKKKPSLIHMMSGMQRSQGSPRTKAGAKWLSKVKKGQVGPKGEPVALSVVHLSPLGSQVSFTANTMRIENVADWEAISKRYRTLWGLDPEESSIKESEDTTSMVTETAGHNNINAVNAINPMNAITTATT
ncbi:uncharacterized protein LOC113366088 [Ctenocephalides felis]|uniref:uncharacterized protein LOC113366088 n=1 Tax=Ctenocephalides felis TaxID=7515 RepID=UPI000E6E1B19|nr:uncharacterized protein LOC113366088 [Ctenocephalides felis]